MSEKLAYSILYRDPEQGDYTQCAIDWSWHFKNQWARSEKNGPGSQWIPRPGLDEKAYQALLKHFGLENFANEFPIEKIIKMSPAKLAAARRKKEKQCGLQKKTIISDTIGHHIPAVIQR
jgi:hypothetical protein